MRALAAVALLSILPTGTAMAQWYVGLEVGTARYRGSSHDTTSGGGGRLRPGDATTLSIRVDRRVGRLGVAFRASLGTPGVAADRDFVAITDKSTGQLLELATLVAVQVGGIGPSGALRAELGPALHLWNLDDEMRARLGVLGALAYEWPVAGRFSGAARLEGALSRSWFDAGELPPELELRPTWRYGVTLGVRYRL